MKKTLLFFAVMFSVSMSFGQLTGPYTVGGATPDYATIQLACTDLETQGQTGPVVFDIRDGSYSEVITLNAVTGNSATNTITFQSENGDSTLVNVNSSTGNTFTFTDVNYVHFNDISISFTGPFGEAVRFNNGGDGSSFDNTALFYTSVNGTYAVFASRDAGVNDFSFMNSTIDSDFGGIKLTANNGNANNCMISGSTIDANGDGLNIYADNATHNLDITDSEINSANFYAVFIQAINGGMNDLNISNSTLAGINNMAFYSTTDAQMNNATITNSDFSSVNLQGLYVLAVSGFSNWSVINSNFTGLNEAFHMYSDNSEITSVSFENDTIISSLGGSPALSLEALQSVNNVDIMDSYLETDSTSFGGNAIYLNTDGNISDININNNDIKSYSGIEFSHSDQLTFIAIDSNTISTHYDNIYDGSFNGGNNISINNNIMESASEDGIDFSNFGGFDNVIITDNDISVFSRGISFSSATGFDNFTIDNNIIYSDDANGISINADDDMSSFEITNNDVESFGTAIDLYSSTGILNSTIDNNTVYSIDNRGVSVYSDDVIDNLSISDNGIEALEEGVEIFASGDISNILTSDNFTYSDDNDGYSIVSFGVMSDIEIMNDSIESNGRGIDLYCDYDISNLTIDNMYISSTDDGIWAGSFAEIVGANISNCEIYADTAGCCANGIYLASFVGWIEDVNIVNNDIFAYERGIDITLNNDNSVNSKVLNNNIWTGSYGVYFYGAGSNTRIDSNNIYPNQNYGTQTDYGVYTYGDNGPSMGISVSNNHIENAGDYGIYTEYHNNVSIENNEIGSDEANNNLYGVYCFEIYGNANKIQGNKILTVEENYGIYLRNCYLSPSNPMLVSNNFVSGFGYSLYLDNANGIDLIHNSISSGSVTEMAHIANSGDINAFNNIFKNYNTSGDMYFGSGVSNILIDYNAFDFDTTVANISSAGDLGLINSLYDLQTTTTVDSNSFYFDPMFVNDTTDLHISCTATGLIAGTPTAVTTDIDGLNRNLTTPTIGAHEISPAATNLLNDSTYFCNTANLMTSIAGTYLWSTGETTPMITVNAVGTYLLTHTDACGNVTNDSTVVWTDTPVADFAWGLNGYEGVFVNQSTGGTSYAWDFGDGNTSTDENPVHVFGSTDASYTVLLTVTNACGGVDTISQVVTISNVGIETESLENRGLNVYPNPTKGDVTIDFALLLGENITINLVDLDGRIVYSDIVNNQVGAYQKQLNIAELAAGMYLLKVDTDTESITKRIIKQ